MVTTDFAFGWTEKGLFMFQVDVVAFSTGFTNCLKNMADADGTRVGMK